MLSLGQRVCTLAMLIVITKLPPKELYQLLFPQALQACRLITYNLRHVCPGRRGVWSRDFTSFSFSPFQVCAPRRAADERPLGVSLSRLRTLLLGGFSPCLPKHIVNKYFQVPTACQVLCPAPGRAVDKTEALPAWSLPSSGRRQTVDRQVADTSGVRFRSKAGDG